MKKARTSINSLPRYQGCVHPSKDQAYLLMNFENRWEKEAPRLSGLTSPMTISPEWYS